MRIFNNENRILDVKFGRCDRVMNKPYSGKSRAITDEFVDTFNYRVYIFLGCYLSVFTKTRFWLK